MPFPPQRAVEATASAVLSVEPAGKAGSKSENAAAGGQPLAAGASTSAASEAAARGQQHQQQHRHDQRQRTEDGSSGSEVMDSEMLDAQLAAAAVQVCCSDCASRSCRTVSSTHNGHSHRASSAIQFVLVASMVAASPAPDTADAGDA